MSYEEYHKVEIVLEVITLKQENGLLKTENEFLKSSIQAMLCDEVNTKHRIVTDEMKEKWKFYHQHKDTVLKKMCEEMNLGRHVISWQAVKNKTDAMFLSNKS